MPDLTSAETNSMPPALAALIGGTQLFQPDIEHHDFKRHERQWRLYLDLYELDGDKLKEMVERHHDKENPEKFKNRQRLASVYNLIPTVIRMIVSYIYSEQPNISVGNDTDLAEFLKDCDGNGTPWVNFVKEMVLPMTMVLGMVDVLVQNPMISVELRTQADKDSFGVRPTVYPILPLQRINWSAQPNHKYNWLCFRERGNDNPHPLRRNAKALESWITVTAAVPELDNEPSGLPADKGFWIRSWRHFTVIGTGTPPVPAIPTARGDVPAGAGFDHEADFCPTARVPVATIYHQRSNDPERRHFGLSKIAMMAVLTKAIIQILSWTNEEMLFTLSLMALPSKGGQPPSNKDGQPMITEFTAATILWFASDAKNVPTRIPGDATMLEVKFKLIEMHIREILRLANLLGASAEAEKISSGVQGVVMRNELFRELKDYAGALDQFTLEALSLAKSWATDEDWTVERLQKANPDLTCRFFKGPYATEPLEATIKAAAAAIEMFREISPTAAQSSYEQTVRSLIPADDPDLKAALAEIDTNTGTVLQRQSMESEIEAAAKAADDTETSLKGDLRTEKTSLQSNAA